MLFIGMYDTSSTSFEPAEIEELEAAVSRVPKDKRNIISRPHFALATVDFGSSAGSFFLVDDPEEIGVVIGRPYLCLENVGADATALIGALKDRDLDRLSSARGSFCGFRFDQKSISLRLCIDKVGVFPIYIAKVGSRVYFSNALRMFNNLSRVPKQVVLDQMFPSLAFGYCLARDTPFSDIDRMYGGEIVEINQSGICNKQYWNWNRIESHDYSEEELEENVHNNFMEAVRIRIDSTPGELCFLSGGLDSRCIVAALRNTGRQVWTLNFAPAGSQDHLFGRLVADALGAHHFELGLERGNFSNRQKKILDSWAEANQTWVAKGVKPHRVWSGDGGSVGLGHVYLDDVFLKLLREKNIRKACEYFIQIGKRNIPLGMLRSQIKHAAENSPVEKMIREIERFSFKDPAKSGLLFLLLNDQRHHLADYFENLDLCQFEVVLPFFDSKLLELIVAAPIDRFLRHTFYNKWLTKFGSAISTVPWQAYPGHMPCPLPTDRYGELRYQWNEDWFDEKENYRKWLEDMKGLSAMLRDRCFPTELLSRNKLWIAYWATRLKIRDYKYVLDAAKSVNLNAGMMK